MKERPILFSAPMVTAILDGRKTQTRRIGHHQMPEATELGVSYCGHATKGTVAQATYRAYPTGGTARWAICECPYGVPGDRLWVRETWGTNPCYDYLKPSLLTRHSFSKEPNQYFATRDADSNIARWRPSIFLPRWASRITLEITDLRAERLQDISEEDALAEGIPTDREAIRRNNYKPVAAYKELWESINGEGSWSADPFVWVINFRKL